MQGFGAAPGGLATCGCSRFDFPDGSHGVLIAAGNIALIAPRPAQTQPDDEMQPATASSEPPLSEPVLSEPVLQPGAPAMPVIEQPVAPQPAADYQQPAQSGEAPAGFALFDAFAEPAAADEPPAEAIPPATETIARAPPPAIEAFAGQPVPQARRLPLRFTWQMDREGRFTLGTDEFLGLIGPRTTAAFGRPWREIAETFGFDPTGRMMQAFATGATWSGITLNWPVDGGGTLPVELSGLPIFDAARNFIGYRGFGVCRDFDAIARLAALRLAELSGEMVTPQEPSAAPSAEPASVASPSSDELPEPIAAKTSAAETSAAEPSHQNDLETPVEPPKEAVEESVQENVPESVQESVQEIARDTPTETATELPADAAANVLPFRAPGEAKQPALTPVENSAFDELARQLSARLDTENGNEAVTPPAKPSSNRWPAREAAPAPPEWLAPPEPPARGEAARDKALLDLLPVGILIYRLDRLLYANPAFLTQMGYPSLHALEDAGGLDALYVEPGVSNASSTSDTGKPVTISASQPADSRRCAVIGRRRPPLHDFMGRRFGAGLDLLGHAPRGRGDRGRHRASRAGIDEPAVSEAEPAVSEPEPAVSEPRTGRCRACQRRRPRRHPRHHGRRHRDVRRRGQHPCGQPQRRSAVRP